MSEGNFNDLSHTVFTAPSMVVEGGVLPVGGKMIIGGEPKIGKSMIVLRMLRDLAVGADLWGCPHFRINSPHESLYFEQEIGEQMLQQRMLQIFSQIGMPERKRVNYMSKDMSLRLDDTAGITKIHDSIKKCLPQVVVFDPISKFHLGDENSAQEMGLVAQRLDWLAGMLGHATVLIHHYSKPNFDDMRRGAQRLRGSSVFAADPDTIITIDQMTDTRLERKWKLTFQLRHAMEPDPVILRLDKPSMEIYFDGYQGKGQPIGTQAPQVSGKVK